MGHRHASAAALFSRAVELYDESYRTRDPAALEACLALYHPDVELTAATAAWPFPAKGREGLRQAVARLLDHGARHHHERVEVVEDRGARAVVRYTLVMEQNGTPQHAVAAECEVTVRDGLIGSMHVREWAPSPPVRPPSGSRRSGEIVGRAGSDALLVRLVGGQEIEVPAADEIAEHWAVGDVIEVFFGQSMVVGWYLPEKGIGVDLRGE